VDKEMKEYSKIVSVKSLQLTMEE